MMLIKQRYPDFCPGLTEILLVLPDILPGLPNFGHGFPDIWAGLHEIASDLDIIVLYLARIA